MLRRLGLRKPRALGRGLEHAEKYAQSGNREAGPTKVLPAATCHRLPGGATSEIHRVLGEIVLRRRSSGKRMPGDNSIPLASGPAIWPSSTPESPRRISLVAHTPCPIGNTLEAVLGSG